MLNYLSTERGIDPPMSNLPLPLSCTVNLETTPITENDESTFERNNILRVKISVSPFIHTRKIVQSETRLIGESYLVQPTIIAQI